MNDRDRLAADLDPLVIDLSIQTTQELADRLIDLGWTRLDEGTFVESIGLTCCPHTEPASLREHIENEGSCVVCREYIAHTDDGHRLVAWPCPTVRAATLDEERLARALRDHQPPPRSEAVVAHGRGRCEDYCAAVIAKAYREDDA